MRLSPSIMGKSQSKDSQITDKKSISVYIKRSYLLLENQILNQTLKNTLMTLITYLYNKNFAVFLKLELVETDSGIVAVLMQK